MRERAEANDRVSWRESEKVRACGRQGEIDRLDVEEQSDRVVTETDRHVRNERGIEKD